MKLGLVSISDKFLFCIGFLSVLVLLVSAAALVTTQYRVRLLFVEIERANDVARRLADDSSQLALDLSKAALPAAVSRRAVQLGFATADVNNTVLLEVAPKALVREHMEVRK